MIWQLGELPEIVSRNFSVLGQEDEGHGRDLPVRLALLALEVEPMLLDLGKLERLRSTTTPFTLEIILKSYFRLFLNLL
jgi:hypothetical protein